MSSLSQLLMRWHQLRRQGKAVSAAELCADCPELAAELEQEIRAVVSMEARLSVSMSRAAQPATAPPWEVMTSGSGSLTEIQARPGAAPARFPQVKGYQVTEQLGRGGMGVVYKARQLSLKRPVALKMILGERPDSDQLVRFRLEAEAVARLQHPNIVQIFEVGNYEGFPFLSLEFVDGGSLAKKLGGKPIPVFEAVRMTETLARAVHYAHRRGVVHRDLKPANVLLAADGTPKIADFGLAKHLDAREDHTRLGAVMGTPSYMAPEQARGRNRDIGPATDVYALGAILYELLTGRPPFRAASVADVLAKVLFAEPVPPRSVRPEVSVTLESVSLKCLRKLPEERYPDAGALAEELRNLQSGIEAGLAGHVPLPLQAHAGQDAPFPATPRGGAPRRDWVRKGVLLAAICLAVAASLGGLLLTRPFGTTKTEERPPEPPPAFRISMNGLGGMMFMNPVLAPEAWKATAYFARVKGTGEMKYPLVRTSRYVLDMELENRNTKGGFGFRCTIKPETKDEDQRNVLWFATDWHGDDKQLGYRLWGDSVKGTWLQAVGHYKEGDRLKIKLAVNDESYAFYVNSVRRAVGNELRRLDLFLQMSSWSPETDLIIHGCSFREFTTQDAALLLPG